jgi:hypothetical protein
MLCRLRPLTLAISAISASSTDTFCAWRGDAQHYGYADPVGFVGHLAAYVQGGRQTDFSAQQERAPINAQMQQMPPLVFPPGPFGYHSITNSTARDQNRLAWTDGSPQPPPYNPEANAWVSLIIKQNIRRF